MLNIDWAAHGLKPLNARQELWLSHYVVTLNASKSGRLAGYRHGSKQGTRNLKTLKAYVSVALEKYNAPREEILSRNTSLVRFNPLNYVRQDGSFDIEKINADGFGWMVKEFEVSEKRDAKGALVTTTKVKFYDTQRAMEMAMKMHGMFAPDRVKIDYESMSDAELKRMLDGK